MRLIELVKASLEKPWDWKRLSRNSAITWDDIVDNPTLLANVQLPWNWIYVNFRTDVRIEHILAHPDKVKASCWTPMKVQWVLDYPLDWDYDALSGNRFVI